MRRGISFVITVIALGFAAPSGYAGISNLRGWDYREVDYYTNPEKWTALGSDIDGEVGHPLTVQGPGADCPPSGHWSANGSVISGTLPPGLTLDDGWTISGIPKERGHWIVTMELSGITCNDAFYNSVTQQLRFHITGTGKVIE